MELVDVVGSAAAASSILCQMVGLQICVQIVRKGGTDLISPVPFLSYFVSGCLWVKYGLLQRNSNLVLTNLAGSVLQLLYLFIFYTYTSKKSHFHRLLVLALVVLFSPLVYVQFVVRELALAARNLGLICCTMSVCVYASPMATLRDICRSKSSESMSFWLVLFNFVSAICWVTYGVLLKDLFVVSPNMLGVMFGLVQFSLFCIYPSVRHRHKVVNPVFVA